MIPWGRNEYLFSLDNINQTMFFSKSVQNTFLNFNPLVSMVYIQIFQRFNPFSAGIVYRRLQLFPAMKEFKYL